MPNNQSTNGAKPVGAQTADGMSAKVETMPNPPACLEPLPLIEGEDADACQQMLALVIDVVRPTNIMEWFWVRDIADLQWEILRFRRAKAMYVEKTAKRPLEYQAVLREDNDSLWPVKLDFSHVLKVAMDSSDQIGRVERIVTAMEARRDRAFREIERHRKNSNVRSPRAAKQIEDAEFRVIEPNNSVENHAA